MNRWFVASLIALAGSDARLVAAPLSATFTYQGQLKQDRAPASGLYDFEFRLFDLAEGGVQQGGVVPKNDILVENGLIAVELDFGDVLDGDRRWLDVRVRDGASTGTFTTLAPRQELTAAPYALYALDGPGAVGAWSVNGAHIHNTNAGNVGIGTTTPASPLHLSGAAQIMQKIASPHVAGTWLDLENTSAGGKRWGLVSTGSSNGEGPGKLLLRAITDGRSVMTLQGDGNVGIGVNSPGARLDVADTARITSPTTAGARLRLRGQAGGLSLALGAVDFVDANDIVQGSVGYTRSFLGDRLILSAGQADRLAIDQDGNVGIGTLTPGLRLDVADRIRIREGSTGTAGIWLYQEAPAADRGFIGMRTDDQMGFYGTGGLGWGLVMNRTGGNVGIGTAAPVARLDVNGSTRVAGDLNVEGNLTVSGATSISIGYQIVTNSMAGDGGSENISVSCPAGKKVLGGGCFHSGNSGTLTASNPAGDSGWACFWDDTQGGGHTVQAEAICANVD
jgi:hypothetical protein